MKYTIKSCTRRITGGLLYLVEAQPSWFARVVLRRPTVVHEMAVPKKIAGDKVALAKLMYHYLSQQ